MTLVILPGTRHNEGDYSVDPQVIDSLWQMEERHFWHQARNAWIRAALELHGARPPEAALDVGCGSGAVSRYLHALGYQVTGVDTAEPLVRKAHDRCGSATFVVGDVGGLPPESRGPYRVVGFFDVLEHLSEPEALLQAAMKWAAPEALIVATVPALRSLHSVVDDLSGHKRRYEPGELSQLFQSVGLLNPTEYGIFRSSLGLIRWQRRRPAAGEGSLTPEAARAIMRRTLKVPFSPVNQAMKLVCGLERMTGLKAARGKVGGSLIGVARMPAASS